MRIAVDAVGSVFGGGAAVLREVVAAIRRVGVDALILTSSEAVLERLELGSRISVKGVPDAVSRAGRLWYLNHGLSEVLRATQVDGILLLNGVGRVPPWLPSVSFVQQALPFWAPPRGQSGLADWARKMGLRYHMRQAAMAAELVIVQSEWMRSVLECTGWCRRVVVCAPGAEEPVTNGFETAEPGACHAVRWLYVGSDSAHKNVRILGPAARLAARDVPGLEVLATIDAKKTEGLVGLGQVEPLRVKELFRTATGFVMPSLVETVGLPLLEAMAARVPVVAADRAYAREVCDDAAVYFDPTSAEQLGEAMVHVSRHRALRVRMQKRGVDIVRRRNAAKPYDRMLSHVVEALGAARSR